MSVTTEEQLSAVVAQVNEKAGALQVKTEAEYVQAGELLKQVKSNIKTVSEFFEPMKKSAHAAWKAICDKENSFVKPMQAAETTIKKVMGAYVMEQERIRREKEAELRRQQEELARKQAEEAARLEAEGKTEQAEAVLEMAMQVETMAPVIDAPKPKVSGIGTQKDWSIEIVDGLIVPIQFEGVVIRPVDLAAIKRLVKAKNGQITIPGIKITEDVTMRVRA